MNIAEIESSLRDLAENPFDAGSFIYRFMEIYDAPKSTVTKLRQAKAKGGDLLPDGDLIWKKKLFFRVALPGRAADAVDVMAADPNVKKLAPRFLIATDGEEVYALDTKADQTRDIPFAKLNDAFDFFLPLAGIERYEGVAENPADIKATARLAKLYDAILEANPDWIGGDRTHEMNMLMTRMLFCFFAEDTSIFEKDLFTSSLLSLTREDGSDTADVMRSVFAALSVKDRAGMPEFARRFPYVNGGLFKEHTSIPVFSRRARRLLKECGELSWSAINPDIFGSMIQAVVEPGMRGDMGMHYTSVPNIMKVLQPLFLMSLEEEFEASRDSEAKLRKLLKRIYGIRVFDPACGSGNFLIIAYRELRRLESRIFEQMREIGQRFLPMTGVRLTQFCGIELADFAAETAKLSLWIAEYQMNEVFKAEFGSAPPALPLSDSGNIIHGNACRLDWLKVCTPSAELETYIVGNPPYLGNSQQSAEQKADLQAVFSEESDAYKKLDYVACWFAKGAAYCSGGDGAFAFVSTNSLCQGEQVNLLWPGILDRGLEIGFAHQSFKWKNNAAKNAGVICVVVGVRPVSKARKVLYEGDLARTVQNISPYLLDMDNTIVRRRPNPVSALAPMDNGNKPTDGGNLLLDAAQRDSLLAEHPESAALIRRYYGSKEFIQGQERWCLWITDDLLPLALSVPPVKERIDGVRDFRLASTKKSTAERASVPHQFEQIRRSGEDVVVVPRHFSEHRDYLTVGFVQGEQAILSDACSGLYGSCVFEMAILSSRMHALWTATVGGRIKTDYRYSNALVYNTFPVPMLSAGQRKSLEDHVWLIIEARETWPGKTMAWLYDPETMPPNILKAHMDLDETLETIYAGRTFRNDTLRLEHLFRLYAAMIRKEPGGKTAAKAKQQ